MPSDCTTTVSSRSETVEIHRDRPTVLIGERINPTGSRSVREALRHEQFDYIRQEAARQVDAGAAILDINASVPGLNESKLLRQVAEAVMGAVDVPLSIDTASPDALLGVLEIYEGRALVNSVTGASGFLDAILPLVRDHNAVVIGLCMDDQGVSDEPEERLRIAERIVERAAQMGIPADDVIIDPLALAMGAESRAGLVALQATELIVRELGVNITMGISNVSFGMPDRRRLNAAFIAMAIHAGLTCPIANPLDEDVRRAILAADLAMGRDELGLHWIKTCHKRRSEGDSPGA